MTEIIKSNRKSERLLGVFFLTVILAYGIGNGLINALLNKPDYLARTILSIPGGLLEIFSGIWLIIKGFNSTKIVPETY